jgi:plasmid stability protein
MIQIRNVPDEIHRKIKARAALAGTSMSEFLLRELERIAARPTRQEILARIASRPSVDLEPSAAEILREEREQRLVGGE